MQCSTECSPSKSKAWETDRQSVVLCFAGDTKIKISVSGMLVSDMTHKMSYQSDVLIYTSYTCIRQASTHFIWLNCTTKIRGFSPHSSGYYPMKHNCYNAILLYLHRLSIFSINCTENSECVMTVWNQSLCKSAQRHLYRSAYARMKL